MAMSRTLFDDGLRVGVRHFQCMEGVLLSCKWTDEEAARHKTRPDTILDENGRSPPLVMSQASTVDHELSCKGVKTDR